MSIKIAEQSETRVRETLFCYRSLVCQNVEIHSSFSLNQSENLELHLVKRDIHMSNWDRVLLLLTSSRSQQNVEDHRYCVDTRMFVWISWPWSTAVKYGMDTHLWSVRVWWLCLSISDRGCCYCCTRHQCQMTRGRKRARGLCISLSPCFISRVRSNRTTYLSSFSLIWKNSHVRLLGWQTGRKNSDEQVESSWALFLDFPTGQRCSETILSTNGIFVSLWSSTRCKSSAEWFHLHLSTARK